MSSGTAHSDGSECNGLVMPDSAVERPKAKTMMLFANGNIAVFDESGNQISGLQSRTAIELFAEWADANGFDVEGCEFRVQAPNGDGGGGLIKWSCGDFYGQWL